MNVRQVFMAWALALAALFGAVAVSALAAPEPRQRFAGAQVAAIGSSLTAHALPEERERCLDAGMVDQTTKPIDLAELAATIHRVLARRQSSIASPAAQTGASEAEAPAVAVTSASSRSNRMSGASVPYFPTASA